MRIYQYIILIIGTLLLSSCESGNSVRHNDLSGDTIDLKYATNLTMVDYGDYMIADFRNPWDTTKQMQRVVMVDRDKADTAQLPQGLVVKVPIEKSVVYTSVHASLLDELGCPDAITGVCDAKYMYKPEIKDRIDSGEIIDCGGSMTPSIEKIIMINPDVILLSAFESSTEHNKVGQIGIPIIDCIDYMEPSPLAMAEWVKFYGRLYGVAQKADSLFDATEQNYLAIKEQLQACETKPKVLCDLIYGQTWSIPSARSTTGMLIADAGGANPFDTYKSNGSVRLAPEQVLYSANDADVWIMRYGSDDDLTLSQLKSDNPMYGKFKAFVNGNVFGCNVNYSSFFEDTQFHPDWILAEYGKIFHPESGIESQHNYFTKLKP